MFETLPQYEYFLDELEKRDKRYLFKAVMQELYEFESE